MLPGTIGEGRVDGRTSLGCREPRIYDEAGARVELVRLGGEIDVVGGIEQSRCRDLGSLGTADSRVGRRVGCHREHGHAFGHVWASIVSSRDDDSRERLSRSIISILAASQATVSGARGG